MKALSVILAGLLCSSAQAATSDILFPRGGSSFSGAAGNVVFNGQQFVTPTVQSNGAIQFVFLDTNGVAVSNLSLSITGSSPRIVLNGSDFLLAWLNTNAASSELNCTRVAGGVTGAISVIGTNVANETISLSGKGAPFVVIWQNADSNSIVLARTLDSNGRPTASSFAVSSSTQPQRYPSVDTDGTNFLVCWMEQNVTSNDWRVVARMISNGAPVGPAFSVSDTNSLLPHATACSFGMNYLVAWIQEAGLSSRLLSFLQQSIPGSFLFEDDRRYTNYWPIMIFTRIVSLSGALPSNPVILSRNPYMNTNPAIVFGDGGYMIAWMNQNTFETNPSSYELAYPLAQRVQRLHADGTGWNYPIIMSPLSRQYRTVVAGFGAGRHCVLYVSATNTISYVFDRDNIEAPRLVNLRRNSSGGISVESTSVDYASDGFWRFRPTW